MVCKQFLNKSKKELFNIGGQYDDYPDNTDYYHYTENSNSRYENRMNNGNKGCDITVNGQCYIATSDF